MKESEYRIRFTAEVAAIRSALKELDKLEKKSKNTAKAQASFNKQQAKTFQDLNTSTSVASKVQKEFSKSLKDSNKSAQQLTKSNQQNVGLLNRLFRRGGGREGAGKGGMGAGSLALGGVGALVGAGLGVVMGGFSRGYETYINTQRTFGRNIGLGLGNLPATAMLAGEGKGGTLGYNIQERSELQNLAARATGADATKTMMAATRATGMEAGEATDLLTTLRQSGSQFGPQRGKQVGQGEKVFAKLLATANASELPKTLVPEFLKGVNTLVQRQQEATGGAVNAEGIAKLVGMFQKSGFVGAQGARGAKLLQTLDEGLKRPGGGEEGMAWARMMTSGYGMPGSKTSFISSEYERELGLFGKGDSGKRFGDVMGRLKTMVPGEGKESNYTRSKVLQELAPSLTLRQGDLIQKIAASKGTWEEKQVKIQEQIDEDLKKNGTLEERAQVAMAESGTHLDKMAQKFDKSFFFGEQAAPLFEFMTEIQEKILQSILKVMPALQIDSGSIGESYAQLKAGRIRQEQQQALESGDITKLRKIGLDAKSFLANNDIGLSENTLKGMAEQINREQYIAEQTASSLVSGQQYTPEEIRKARKPVIDQIATLQKQQFERDTGITNKSTTVTLDAAKFSSAVDNFMSINPPTPNMSSLTVISTDPERNLSSTPGGNPLRR